MSDPFLSSDDYDERAHQLYNEGQYDEAIDTLREGLGLYPHAVELLAGMGYARLAREEFAWARHAFEEARGLDPGHEDTPAGQGEVLLKLGERAAPLPCSERVPDDAPELGPWNERLNQVAGDAAPEDILLSEIAAMTPDGQIRDPRQLELFGTLLTELQGMKNKGFEVHRVSTISGATYVGTWEEIVRQMKDDAAEWIAGSLEEYMEASAKRWRKQTGAAIPATDPESFLRASADAGVLRIVH